MGGPFRSGRWRGVVGALAIYAVILQALLAGLAGPALSAPGTDPSICSPEGGHGSDPGGGPARHADHRCCLAACALAALPPPPDGVGAAVAWPIRSDLALSWSPADDRLATGPPPSAIHARGPPCD